MGSIIVQLSYSLTGLDSFDLLLINNSIFSCLIEFKSAKLETSRTVILPPYGECLLTNDVQIDAGDPCWCFLEVNTTLEDALFKLKAVSFSVTLFSQYT